jgi:hypothetical protein
MVILAVEIKTRFQKIISKGVLSESGMTCRHAPGEHRRGLLSSGFLALRENPGETGAGRKQGKDEMTNEARLR